MNSFRRVQVAFGVVFLLSIGALGLGATSCSIGTVPTIDCTTTTVKTYTELKSSTMAYCTDCHGANRADRGIRYDSYEAAKAAAADGADTIADGSMPQDISMPDSAAQDFYAWAQCGTPE